MKAEAGPILAAALTGVLLGAVMWSIPGLRSSALASELQQELGRVQAQLRLLRQPNPGAAQAARADHSVGNGVLARVDSGMASGRRQNPPLKTEPDPSQSHALPGIETEATCKVPNRRHPCQHHPKPIKDAVEAALQRAAGPNGTLLMVGDSTMRYQFGTFCNCLQVEMCSAIRAKGTIRRVQLCGPTSVTSTRGRATRPIGSTLAVYDEIAGGPYHVPWTHSANRANATLQRFHQVRHFPAQFPPF